MKNRRLHFFLTINFLLLVGLFISIFYAKHIINREPDQVITLSSYTLNGKPDDLSYRLFDKPDAHMYDFRTTVAGDDLLKLDSDVHRLIVYRLVGHWYKVYFNNVLIGTVGNLTDDRSNIWNSLHSFDIDRTLIEDENEVSIQVCATYELGLSTFPVLITNTHIGGEIVDWFRFILTDFYLITTGAIVFAFLLILFLQQISSRAKREFIYFALATFFALLYYFDFMAIYHLPVSYFTFKKIIIICLYAAVSSISMAIYKRFRQKINLYLAKITIFSILVALIISKDILSFKSMWNVLNLLILLNIVSWIYTTAYFFKRCIDAKIILQASIILLLFSSFDIYYILVDKFPFISMSIYGTLQFSLAMISMVVFNYLDLQKKVVSKTERSRVMYQRAIRDGMTGVFNHQYILQALQKTTKPFSIIMVDIDDFKLVNDSFGHWAGDQVIKFVAAELKRHVRKNDLIGRYGGDEFVMVLFNRTSEEAATIANAVKKAVEVPIHLNDTVSVHVTLSVGVYTPDPTEDGEVVLRKVDQALYNSKQTGKDRVTNYNELLRA